MSNRPLIELTCLVHGKFTCKIKEVTSIVPLSDEDAGTRITLYNGSVYRVTEDYDTIVPFFDHLIARVA